jgi:2-polyprenyl-3-methyl-5-hydroxy-6-metoxy-1,4-benzoquinol methylase
LQADAVPSTRADIRGTVERKETVMKTITTCPICGAKPLFTVRKTINRARADEFMKAALDEYYLKLCHEPKPSEAISICSSCRSLYRAVFFDDAEIKQIYDHLYHESEKRFSQMESYVYNKKTFLDACSEQMFSTVQSIEKNCNVKIQQIFDIGGRDGFRLSKLADAGYKCTVFDPIACTPCNDKINKENKWAHEIPSGSKADLIIMCNVLEHCIDPYATIQSCREHLGNRGHLFIELPTDVKTTLRWIAVGRFLGFNLSIDVTHNIFYSLKGISHLLGRSGFIDITHTVNRLPSTKVNVINTVGVKS